MEQKNYYDILGVTETAGADEIKQAYRRLAKEHHPDRHAGDAGAEARFKEIGEAYEVLKDAEKRRRYDELRRYGAGQAQGSMSYEDFMNRFGGYRDEGGRQEEFTWGFGGGLDDIFAQLFGGSGSGSRRGGRRGFRFDFGGAQGHGSHSAQQEAASTPDAFFKRKGRDAYVDIPINLAQALLGSTIRVRTPQGKKVNVRIAPGTQPETVLRVPGLGFADVGAPGDLYIRTHLRLPADLDAEQKERLEALFRDMGMKF